MACGTLLSSSSILTTPSFPYPSTSPSSSSSSPPPALSFKRIASVAHKLSLFTAPRATSRHRNPKSFAISCTRCALTPQLKTTLDKVVTSHKVVLFIKGTKEFPQCGFSNTVVQILKSLNFPFETINILENDMLRQALKEYSKWPTFPQLYIDGEFFGGCDITVDAYKRGELQELLEKAMCSWRIFISSPGCCSLRWLDISCGKVCLQHLIYVFGWYLNQIVGQYSRWLQYKSCSNIHFM